VPLSINTTWNPRPACSDGQDNDSDGDWVCDDVDICLGIFDPDQIDSDLDGFGNRCDADFNGDGVANGADFIHFRSVFGSSLGDSRFDPDVDSDGDDTVGPEDFINFRARYLEPLGPSALPCAGTPPCFP